jgi:hypothetical protein
MGEADDSASRRPGLHVCSSVLRPHSAHCNCYFLLLLVVVSRIMDCLIMGDADWERAGITQGNRPAAVFQRHAAYSNATPTFCCCCCCCCCRRAVCLWVKQTGSEHVSHRAGPQQALSSLKTTTHMRLACAMLCHLTRAATLDKRHSLRCAVLNATKDPALHFACTVVVVVTLACSLLRCWSAGMKQGCAMLCLSARAATLDKRR